MCADVPDDHPFMCSSNLLIHKMAWQKAVAKCVESHRIRHQEIHTRFGMLELEVCGRYVTG